MGDFKDLALWQEARILVKDIYRVTSAFPSAERYGLASQLRRAAVSIASNVAEGAALGGSRNAASPSDRAWIERRGRMPVVPGTGYRVPERGVLAAARLADAPRWPNAYCADPCSRSTPPLATPPPSTPSHRPSTIDQWPWVIDHRPSTIDQWPWVIDHRRSTIAHRPPAPHDFRLNRFIATSIPSPTQHSTASAMGARRASSNRASSGSNSASTKSARSSSPGGGGPTPTRSRA